MPRIKSAKKRVKISLRNQERNKSWRSAVRTVRNKAVEAVAAGGETFTAALSVAYSVIDRAVSKGVLHKNSAARKKSKLAKLHAVPKATKTTKTVKATKTNKAGKTKKSA